MKKMKISAALIGLAGIVLGQGSLTPPGAPGATMKTLDQLDTAISQIQGEARMPISQAGTTISAAGSYILTTNLVSAGNGSGLSISADNVTVDLNGFSILGGGATGQGISMNDRDNVVIKNGTIRDAYYFGTAAFRTQNCRFENLNIIGNGRASSSYAGIVAGTNTTVTACIIMDNGKGLEVGPQSKITGNQIINNTSIGLRLYGSGSYVADNLVKGNDDNYNLSDGNQLNLLICEIPESLDWPCSIQLAGTLECTNTSVNGITVTANDVTIDMAGHSLIGPGASSGHGIAQDSALRNLHVFNGKLTEWGGSGTAGIYANGNSAVLSTLQATTNHYGIWTGNNGTISDCTAENNISDGFSTGHANTLSDCVAYKNGEDGISVYFGCSLSECIARENDGNGINASQSTGSTLLNCIAQYNTVDGIVVGAGGLVSGCSATFNTDDGIQVSNDATVRDCTSDNNGSAGIHATGGDARIDKNHVTDNDRGIDVDYSGNLIVRNSASGNNIQYDIAYGNSTGTITNSPVGAGAWDNFDF